MTIRYVCDECNGEMMGPSEHQLVSLKWNDTTYELPPYSSHDSLICADCLIKIFSEGEVIYHCNPLRGGVLRLAQRLHEK